jgi:undecaprenyl pyrophosphate phosphatase UppP
LAASTTIIIGECDAESIKAEPRDNSFSLAVVGMICSFVAGLLALRWLTRLLERGRWHWFGYYCLVAALMVFAISRRI